MLTPNDLLRYSRGITFKWFMMAFIAGSINAGGYLACHRFVTHLTGFATLFGIEVAHGEWIGSVGMLTVPFFFVLGVMIAAYFTDAALAKGRIPRYGIVMNMVATLLAVAAVAGFFDAFGLFHATFELSRDYMLLAILCAASGLQNAAITTASAATMRSTHLTGITTDLGIGLMRAFFGHVDPDLRRRELYRNWLRFGIIASFISGGVVGAVLFREFHYLGFILPSVLAVYIGNLGTRAVQAVDASQAAPSSPVDAPPRRISGEP